MSARKYFSYALVTSWTVAARIFFGRSTKAAEVAQKSEEYKTEIMTPKIAAKRGYVSEVIEPKETRARIASSLEFLLEKKAFDTVCKKHGNTPL